MIKKLWDGHSHVPTFTVEKLFELIALNKSNDLIQPWKKRGSFFHFVIYFSHYFHGYNCETGFFVLELPIEVAESHSTLLSDFQKFIQMPLEQKLACVSPLQHYLGYPSVLQIICGDAF
jgi:hypothetical protein